MSANKDILGVTSAVFSKARNQLGLTQEKMAEKLKISRREYQYIEYGQRCCSVETLSNLARNCGVDVTEMLYSVSEISQKAKD